jgi:hypothetical protein
MRNVTDRDRFETIIREVHKWEPTDLDEIITDRFVREFDWFGDIYVFRIAGHAEATQCYAFWLYPEEQKGAKIVPLLRSTDSPEQVVRKALENAKKELEAGRKMVDNSIEK